MQQPEFEPEDFEVLKRRLKNEADRKIFQQVFDSKTLKAVQTLANKGLFDVLEHVISTGKESHVFVSSDVSGQKRAVKIFKKDTTGFKKMNQYIEGDIRFRDLPHDRMNLVFAWTKKEYKNLLQASDAALNVPMPVGSRENIIVMEFIGKNQEGAPRLKDSKPSAKELEKYKSEVIDFIARLYLAGLVHADLSEYNILCWNKKLVFIDFAQSLLLSHPRAREFFERDIYNMATYFTKQGIKTEYEELYSSVKKRKEELAK
ncbi:MAG TPA: serine protein kinase RIO [archaeon]|nr:serine protein kinase RIO [archaeon]